MNVSGSIASIIGISFKSALATLGVEAWGFPTVSPSILVGVGFPLNHDDTFCQIELILVGQRKHSLGVRQYCENMRR